MSLVTIFMCIICSFFQAIASTIVITEQLRIESKLRKKDPIKFFFLMWIYCVIVFLFITNQLRFISCIVAMSLIMYFVIKVRDKKVVLYSFNMVILMGAAEVFASIVFVSIGINSVDIVNNPYYNLLINIIISLLTILLIKAPIIKKLIKKIINLFNKRTELINYLYVFLLVLYLIVSKNGLEFLLKSNYYLNILFLVVILAIFLLIIKKEGNYERLKEENKQMYNHVTKYEKIITDQGKANHEFKNQLMVIKGYAQMNPDKLTDYIDSIVEDAKKTPRSYLISQLNKFPDGGIKGLLYYKLSIMDEEKIKYELDIEPGVKRKLDLLSTNMYKHITKILGVLLDNAIDASKISKDKRIIISVSKDKSNVVFSISNTYKGKLDISKIGSGYTTKGLGHGYGLRLVKDVLDEARDLEVKNAIENNYYVVTLIIKAKQKKKK